MKNLEVLNLLVLQHSSINPCTSIDLPVLEKLWRKITVYHLFPYKHVHDFPLTDQHDFVQGVFPENLNTMDTCTFFLQLSWAISL